MRVGNHRTVTLFSFDTLDLVCTEHADDFQETSNEETFNHVCAQLSEQFGELVIRKKCFEHLGIMHRQLDDFTVESTQDHYVKQL